MEVGGMADLGGGRAVPWADQPGEGGGTDLATLARSKPSAWLAFIGPLRSALAISLMQI